MTRALLMLVLLLPACGPQAPVAPAASKHAIRSMQLNEGQPSRIEYESESSHGTIEIGADVHIGYQSVSVSPDTSGASKTVITLDAQVLDFWGSELKLGPKSYGRLAGEVRVVITREGVTVNGEKR